MLGLPMTNVCVKEAEQAHHHLIPLSMLLCTLARTWSA